jgi:hypothetical protein
MDGIRVELGGACEILPSQSGQKLPDLRVAPSGQMS